jgi:hypothetical protein
MLNLLGPKAILQVVMGSTEARYSQLWFGKGVHSLPVAEKTMWVVARSNPWERWGGQLALPLIGWVGEHQKQTRFDKFLHILTLNPKTLKP